VGVQAHETGQLANGFVQIMGCPKSLEAGGDTYSNERIQTKLEKHHWTSSGTINLSTRHEMVHTPSCSVYNAWHWSEKL
jgi:hypothetical protein